MHPPDLVKVRFQLASSYVPPGATSALSIPGSTAAVTKARLGTGVYNALAEAVKVDGWKGLYRGLVPNLVGGAGSWGCYFLLYVEPRTS